MRAAKTAKAGEKSTPKPEAPRRTPRAALPFGTRGRSRMAQQRSRFLRVLKRGEDVCLLHSLTRKTVYGDLLLESLYHVFEDPATVEQAICRCASFPADDVRKAIHLLAKEGLLIHRPEEDVRLYADLFRRGLHQSDIHHLYLLQTSECNFRCSYCFVEDPARPVTAASYMNQETAEAAVRVLAKLAAPGIRPGVTFYGGEPLLNRQTVFFTLRLLRRLEVEGVFKQPVEVSMITNGSLVDDEVVAVFRETRPGVGVSIDGPERMHNAARKDVRGAGTFSAAVAGFHRLRDAGLQPSVSCTLNAFTIEHIDEILDFFIEELKVSSLGFNLLLPRVGGPNPVSDLDHGFAAKELVRAFKRLRELGIAESRVMRRVKPFVNSQMYYKDCMAVGGQLVVTPSGRVGPCQAYLGMNEPEHYPLAITQLATMDASELPKAVYGDPLIQQWHHRFPMNMSECADCFAISVCGGGCPYAAQVTHGSIWTVDERVCFQAKTILEWMLWETRDNL